MAKKGFRSVSPQVNFPKLEEEILKFWQKEKIFEKSIKNRKGKKKFTFYDGPPFATGLPHYGHILAMTIKDAITRLKTMQGYYVPRRLGWDTHGLPVEYEVEKEIGSTGKKEIEKMGVDKFNELCRNIVFRYTKEWEKTIDRMGRWADKENTYATLDTDYMESIWWVFKTLWDKGLIYKGFRSMPYCPRCGTPLSNFETNLGYKDDVEDPSVYIKFQLEEEPDTYLLAWTTTPWTLPGNAALAVNPKIKYVKVKVAGKYLILAKDRLEVLDTFENEKDVSFKDLVGKKYKPLFDYFETDRASKNEMNYLLDPLDAKKVPYRILEADFVSTGDGTGVVHVAPAFGEDDMLLGQKEGLPSLQPVDKNGELTIEPYKGTFVKDANNMIIEHLDQAGSLYKSETIKHTYPFCWRCETPLLYYAIGNWFVKVSSFREKLVANNSKIHWTPNHIKEGRFGKWLSEARDWSISRNRFWGTPLPVWQCGKCQEFTVIGSVAELKEKTTNFKSLIEASKTLYKEGKQKSSSELVDLHRPHIDAIIVKCGKCGADAKRIEEVLDCWFESGSMPYAQDHYPFENKKKWEDNFPADFIAEGLDQTRGWFYTLHVLASALMDEPAFNNIIVNGIVVDKNGKKLSKRLRNYPEPDEVFDKFGADAMRFYLLSSPASAAEDVRFSAETVEETVRKFFLILWNVYSFFVTYANLENWTPSKNLAGPSSNHVLDKWILSKLNNLILEIQKGVDSYNLPKMTRPLQDFVSDLSTWYIRRSRDRVGLAIDNKSDKKCFFATTHYVLATFTKILAPFSPFISDDIFKNLTQEKSVHLGNWPEASKDVINTKLESQMDIAREIVEKAHSLRKSADIKVRQPLQQIVYGGEKLDSEIEEIISEEINVKSILNKKGGTLLLDTKITDQLRNEGEARDIVRKIQVARKEAGCKLDEQILLELPAWPKEFEDYIKKQTLTQKLQKGQNLRVIRAK
ncbi:isoleucine--tRNA ligase [Candidatus Curtissbacteria bacterium]|nr:isoleucine--tRNA ligase [Candidatus Curtissbacteria bacterium]